ncbi:hypothetical protein JHK82_018103 [Glycine max]|nr:hypothetical protein JHK82_018103 [Glycine max]
MATSLSVFSSIFQHSLHYQSASIISLPFSLSLSPLPKSLLSLSTRHRTFTVRAESQNGVNPVPTHYDFNLFTIGVGSDEVQVVRLATNYGTSVAICEFPFSTISSETTGGTHPQEKIGVFVRRGKGGSLNIVEYSELEQSLASAVNQATGHLRFVGLKFLIAGAIALKGLGGVLFIFGSSFGALLLLLH